LYSFCIVDFHPSQNKKGPSPFLFGNPASFYSHHSWKSFPQ